LSAPVMESVFELCPTTYINLTTPRCPDRCDGRYLNAWPAAYNDACGQGSWAKIDNYSNIAKLRTNYY